MSDSEKWDIAFSHLTHFVQNLPVILDEDDVEQYHDIVGLFEDALRVELSRFKVPADRVKHPVQNPIPCWQTNLPARIDRTYFVGQIWDFAQYLEFSPHDQLRVRSQKPIRRLSRGIRRIPHSAGQPPVGRATHGY